MEERNEKLWQLATQRARFKQGIWSYFAVNVFLWCIWLLTKENSFHGIPWPAWSTLGWGFGLVIKYIKLYHSGYDDKIEKEYEKLKLEGK